MQEITCRISLCRILVHRATWRTAAMTLSQILHGFFSNLLYIQAINNATSYSEQPKLPKAAVAAATHLFQFWKFSEISIV